jgi:hypothetical protein
MSYDVYIEMDTGAGETTVVDQQNYTSNVGQMWAHAINPADPITLGDTIDAHPKATDLQPIISLAVTRMAEDMEFYAEMNPGNGWGDAEGAMGYLAWLALACLKHPNCTVRVSR